MGVPVRRLVTARRLRCRKAVVWTLDEAMGRRRGSLAHVLYDALHSQHVSDGWGRSLRLPAPSAWLPTLRRSPGVLRLPLAAHARADCLGDTCNA